MAKVTVSTWTWKDDSTGVEMPAGATNYAEAGKALLIEHDFGGGLRFKMHAHIALEKDGAPVADQALTLASIKKALQGAAAAGTITVEADG